MPSACFQSVDTLVIRNRNMISEKALKKCEFAKISLQTCSRWKRLIMVNSMQANEAPQERLSAAWR